MAGVVEVDGLIASFRKLTLENMREVGVKAFGECLPIIKQAAEGVLASEGIDIDSVSPKSHRRMRDGITVKTYADGSGGSVAALGEYKLKWFALGTEERYQNIKHGREKAGNAPRYLGRINATHFLKRGAEQAEQEFTTRLEEIISESIDKILNEQ